MLVIGLAVLGVLWYFTRSEPEPSTWRKTKRQSPRHSARHSGAREKLDRHSDRHSGRHPDRHSGRHLDRHSGRHSDRHSGRHSDRHSARHSGNSSGNSSGSRPGIRPDATDQPIQLKVYNLVTETDEACEHVVWFSRCEGDAYEILINNVAVAQGSGADLDVAHLKNYSSLALMTKEKIAFPLTVNVNVLRGNQVYGSGSCEVRGPGEPLPA
jgi:hypothetical protein